MKRVAAALVIALVGSFTTAWTGGNLVGPSRAGHYVESTGANQVKPSDCASVSVTTRVTGSGTIAGTAGPDLILGSNGVDEIDGLGGDDCIVAGGGDDVMVGGPGNDVCIGGPGADTFEPSCEMTIQ